MGIVVRYVRRLKYFAVAGTLLFVLAFGLLYRYRGGVETHELAGLVGAEVILGVAGTSCILLPYNPRFETPSCTSFICSEPPPIID